MLTQWKLIAVLALWLATLGAGLFFGRKWEAANHADEAIKAANERLDAVIAGVEDSNKRAAKLQQTLDRLPKTEKRVNDAVRDNPSNCHRPEPVADSLQAGVREANAARKMSGDP